MSHPNTDNAIRATIGEVWPLGEGTYISRCGLLKCPSCKGANGSKYTKPDGTVIDKWPGRMCQYGARMMADQGRTYKEILDLYYGEHEGGGVVPVVPEESIVARNREGKIVPLEELQEKYFFVIKRAEVRPGDEVWRIKEIYEQGGDSSAKTEVIRGGQLVVGQPVAFHWADAELHAHESNYWNDHFIIGQTDANGVVGPGMGAWITADTLQYWKDHPDDIGPYASWVLSSAPSDLLARIGMLGYPAFTPHDHVNVIYEWRIDPEEIPQDELQLSAAEQGRFWEDYGKYPASFKVMAALGFLPLGEFVADDGNVIGFGEKLGEEPVIGFKIETGTWRLLKRGRIV